MLFRSMWDLYQSNEPVQLKAGEWHIPFGDNMDLLKLANLSKTGYKEELDVLKIKIATARCAKVSYHNHDGSVDYAADLRLYDFLIANFHLSPTEHCAVAMSDEEYKQFSRSTPKGTTYGHCNNIIGFIQHRYQIDENNNR